MLSLNLASGRFAMIDDGLGFNLVPWSPSLERQLGLDVSGIAQAGRIEWSFGRARGPTIGCHPAAPALEGPLLGEADRART
jgi:hypothetical protein